MEDTIMTYGPSVYDIIEAYSKVENLVPLIYHERPDGNYHTFTKNMLTRRVNASDIAFVELHKKKTGKGKKTLVKTIRVVK